ncbi:hypothetical protein [Ochrovirga pacifica]|uniref:hypothetical protein n=1 Tax=Ochrovirga pacifica TaxID=1042376 RepID=UPI000681336C|nr:hypothetical protein [Ochrovirga pacifica]
MKKIIPIFIFLSTCLAMGQSQPNIAIKADTTAIKIGEQITYTIVTSKEKNVIFPKLTLKGLEVAEELPADTLTDVFEKKYLITGFDSGAFYIGKQQVFIDAKAYFTDSLLINVATVQVDTAKLAPYYRAKDIENEKYSFAEFWYRSKTSVYITLAVLVFIVGLYFLFRNKKEEKPKKIIKIPPFITASKELQALQNKQLWQNNQTKAYYSELTGIVRKYIGDELAIQALENTTDELMALLTVENKQQKLGLDKEMLAKLKMLLSQADFVKFAKQRPLESDIRGHESDAELIIKTIHQIVESQKQVANDDE